MGTGSLHSWDSLRWLQQPGDRAVHILAADPHAIAIGREANRARKLDALDRVGRWVDAGEERGGWIAWLALWTPLRTDRDPHGVADHVDVEGTVLEDRDGRRLVCGHVDSRDGSTRCVPSPDRTEANGEEIRPGTDVDECHIVRGGI